MAVFLIGVCGFGYMTGNITKLVSEITYSSDEFHAKITEVEQYMAYREVSPDLEKRVMEYQRHYWSKLGSFDERTIVNTLNPGLKQEVTKHLAKQVLQDNPIFCDYGYKFLMSILESVKPVKYEEGEVITQAGEDAQEMFFLAKGKVSFMSNDNPPVGLYNQAAPCQLGEGGLFGGTRAATVMAATRCELYALGKEEMADVLDEFPEIADKVRARVKAEREKKAALRAQKTGGGSSMRDVTEGPKSTEPKVNQDQKLEPRQAPKATPAVDSVDVSDLAKKQAEMQSSIFELTKDLTDLRNAVLSKLDDIQRIGAIQSVAGSTVSGKKNAK